MADQSSGLNHRSEWLDCERWTRGHRSTHGHDSTRGALTMTDESGPVCGCPSVHKGGDFIGTCVGGTGASVPGGGSGLFHMIWM